MLSYRPSWVLAAYLVLLFSTSHALAGDSKVSGIVTYRGKPIEAGKIFVHLENGEFVGAKVKEDGNYTLSRVPEGTWKVTVEGKGIPAKYTSEDASALTVAVKKGSPPFNIELQ